MPTMPVGACANTPTPHVSPLHICAAYVDAGVTAGCPGSVSNVLTARFYTTGPTVAGTGPSRFVYCRLLSDCHGFDTVKAHVAVCLLQ